MRWQRRLRVGGIRGWVGPCGSHLSLLDVKYVEAKVHRRSEQDRTTEPVFQTQRA